MKLTFVKLLFTTLIAYFSLFSIAQAEERVVATVDGYPIMQSEVDKALGRRANTEKNRQIALNDTIDDFLVQRAIQESGIKVNYAYVDQIIENIAIENGITYGQLLDALDYQGITLNQYRQQLAHDLLMQGVRQQAIESSIQVQPEDVQRLAKEMQDNAKASGTLKTATGTQYHISHILIKTNPILNDAQAKAKLTAIADDINSGKTTFESAAEKNSLDYVSAADGGDLGWNFLEVYDPTFAKIAQQTKIGVLSKPFKSEFGWHIMKVTDTRQADRTEDAYLQRAYEQIINRQAQAASQNWVKALKDRADIKYIK
ncbi:peptidylprolyl isomerase [Otariodibacter oris]|uniref:Periplasmic chaperone for outer membrane proteins SurA n=1 Tax=Otariodibacter oris TaxID=1032623 RepID=A0A420XHJ6_9PAST|nr:peptidylprolyl isomerase [Otariodibacter oris]QGM81266.1 peptidylprolyl isomerase [Otariodibacter oris]RKR72829.1 periplasmic chaperone for outer membrane proteins SurA [Otariodibacter oris]